MYGGEIKPFDRPEGSLSEAVAALAAHSVRFQRVVVANVLRNWSFATCLAKQAVSHSIPHGPLCGECTFGASSCFPGSCLSTAIRATWRLANANGYSASSAGASLRWHADQRPGAISFSAGRSALQRANASGQRGWK